MIDGVAHRQYLVLITALGIDREGHKHPLALPNLREVIRPIYDTLYCARGQAENLIKMHKGQLASDRTSCRSPLANQIASSCTPLPIGSCSRCAMRSPR